MVPAERILETAKERSADIIGLSGLITPSLDQMVHVAREMERLGMDTPLLIGGATTSMVHTAVKIEPSYHGPVVHVLDASRAVGVVGRLLDKGRCDAFAREVRADYEKARERRAAKRGKSELLSLEEARRRRFRTDWSSYEPPTPARPGVHLFDPVPISGIVPYIDWTPFFQAWEIKGKHPDLLSDPGVGEQARVLLADAHALLERIEAEDLLRPRAVVGLFPANAAGDDVTVFRDPERTDVRAVIHGLRQQFEKKGRESLCLSDYVAPADTGLADWIGAFAVSAGHGLEEIVAAFEAEHDDYSAILAKALADRLAEALAELTHERVRTDLWGYAPEESLDNRGLIAESYRGIRPAPGYPACPDHTEKRTLFALLDAEKRTGIHLTESFAMMPGASVSGWYFAHPGARYFGVGRIGRDQVEDYAARKGMSVEETERWLTPSLDYDPDERP
jgi:5-methyltetrahydrofolate--homocysteine methyltransferase